MTQLNEHFAFAKRFANNFSSCCFLLLFMAITSIPQAAKAQQVETIASLPNIVRTPNPNILPKPLTSRDAQIYKDIFRLQSLGAFSEADKLVSQISDQYLLPYTQIHRYLLPNYKASHQEIERWLSLNNDLPEAHLLYALATKKGIKVKMPLEKPINRDLPPNAPGANDRDPDWQKGLTLWAKKQYHQAALSFEKVTGKKHISMEQRAAAAYWAGRAYGAAGNPNLVTKWFRFAAKTPQSFYGQLARRNLGIESGLRWTIPSVATKDVLALRGQKLGKAAFGLIQIGQATIAERQLLRLADLTDHRWDHTLFVISQAAGLPSLAIRIGNDLKKTNFDYVDSALFPVPAWRPKPGYHVNPSFIYAIIRQESGFNPRAVSPAGAKGLMQLLPSTANYLTGNRKVDLLDPVTSIDIGQDYIFELMNDPVIDHDLILTAAAYNAGPGNLKKWYVASKAKDDALLFMETIPSAETRNFVERVIANYWIYRNRLGLSSPSLDQIVNGGWASNKLDNLYFGGTVSTAIVQ